MIRQIIVATIWSFVLTMVTGLAVAQTRTFPNGAGGYTIFHDGSITRTLPNGAGGYNIFGQDGNIIRTLPKESGGNNIFDRNGITETLPNATGGYNTFNQNGSISQTLPKRAGDSVKDNIGKSTSSSAPVSQTSSEK